MYIITYKHQKYLCREGETLLELCLRNGLTVPFSCKQGVCHVCLMQSKQYPLPEIAQKGLKSALIANNYFKACQCIPEQDMQINLPKPQTLHTPTVSVAALPVKKQKFSSQSEKDNQSLERDAPPPDPEMWLALQEGVLLKQILTTFYTWVFGDKILKPYFDNVTQQRLVEKVYSFLYQLFTGKKVFFGERPRNGHHWMVISDEIFAHREALMEKALVKHGLAPHLIQRWLTYEAWYKEDIVKSKPINKVLFGEEVSYEGFDSLIMEFSTLCDSCEAEINVGDTVRYHTRMGTVYCQDCTKLI